MLVATPSTPATPVTSATPAKHTDPVATVKYTGHAASWTNYHPVTPTGSATLTATDISQSSFNQDIISAPLLSKE